jgi:hypothetical protein
MVIHDWPLYANLLAVLGRKSFAHVHRAAFRLDVDDKSVIIALFGNENRKTMDQIQKEIDGFRLDIVETGNQVLGFGLSPDGLSWALIIKPDLDRNQTIPAKVFQMEMLKSFIEDLVTGNRSAAIALEAQNKRRCASEYFPAQ